MANATDDRLRLLIERIERLEEEKKAITEDIRDVYAEAKAVGYCTKTMRQIVKLRKMKPDERTEAEMVLDTYKAALGMAGTPLGDYAAGLAKMDRDGVGVSVRLDGKDVPLNQTAIAAAKAEAVQ